MAVNAAGLEVAGDQNPNWKGGLIAKTCAQCSAEYSVKRTHAESKFCSLKCVGLSQKGKTKAIENLRRVMKECEVCGGSFSIPACHDHRLKCCSHECSNKRRSKKTIGDKNPSWSGGLSRLPYPWNFGVISRKVIERDGATCQNPACAGTDPRMTSHHINYEKQDCRPMNLIALCSACNSKANFGRERWTAFYSALMQAKKDGGWAEESFE